MNTDKDDSQALIGLWQDEEMRPRLLIENPQASLSVKEQAIQRLNSVVEQIRAIADESVAVENADPLRG